MKRPQRYELGVLLFSVAEADRILAQAPREIKHVSPVRWAANFGLIDGDERIDHRYAMTHTDPNRPVYVGWLEPIDGSRFTVVFDGCHRMYRAYHEQRHAVPAYEFTIEETRRILAAGDRSTR